MRDGDDKRPSQGLTFPIVKHMEKRLKGVSEITERRQVGDAANLVNSQRPSPRNEDDPEL